VLNWGLKRGCVVIPKSNSIGRLKENVESLDFSLDEADILEINKIDEGHRICDLAM